MLHEFLSKVPETETKEHYEAFFVGFIEQLPTASLAHFTGSSALWMRTSSPSLFVNITLASPLSAAVTRTVPSSVPV